jgi:hypothetical protein
MYIQTEQLDSLRQPLFSARRGSPAYDHRCGMGVNGWDLSLVGNVSRGQEPASGATPSPEFYVRKRYTPSLPRTAIKCAI